MPAEIDIIVSGPDSIGAQLIVETKLHVADLLAAEARLRNAMLQLSCPVGLIVTPERIWVYADEFRSTTPESIERVGEFAVSHARVQTRGLFAGNGTTFRSPRAKVAGKPP